MSSINFRNLDEVTDELTAKGWPQAETAIDMWLNAMRVLSAERENPKVAAAIEAFRNRLNGAWNTIGEDMEKAVLGQAEQVLTEPTTESTEEGENANIFDIELAVKVLGIKEFLKETLKTLEGTDPNQKENTLFGKDHDRRKEDSNAREIAEKYPWVSIIILKELIRTLEEVRQPLKEARTTAGRTTVREIPKKLDQTTEAIEEASIALDQDLTEVSGNIANSILALITDEITEPSQKAELEKLLTDSGEEEVEESGALEKVESSSRFNIGLLIKSLRTSMWSKAQELRLIKWIAKKLSQRNQEEDS
ncbi:hypothetical protein HOG48_03685 [Candidatus Peregrinibacteria bacterium]|jgi:hypothetical protein|nr:hypothetical protein [Candidatus Peregrinibacteria bacterium]